MTSCPNHAPGDGPPNDLAAARKKIENLEIALNSARRIGMALGIVMASRKVDPDAAFDMLVVASQRTERKLRDIAEDVVQTGELDWAPVCDRASTRPGSQVRAPHLS